MKTDSESKWNKKTYTDRKSAGSGKEKIFNESSRMVI